MPLSPKRRTSSTLSESLNNLIITSQPSSCSLEKEKAALGESEDRANKLQTQKNDLDRQVSDLSDRLGDMEDRNADLQRSKKKAEGDIGK